MNIEYYYYYIVVKVFFRRIDYSSDVHKSNMSVDTNIWTMIDVHKTMDSR